jgi:lipopolysaccharide transport system permease protein
LWVLVVPVMQLMTLVFVFKKVVPLNIEGYPAFVFTALLPWTWFSNSLSSAGGLFVGNRDLIKRPNFPPIILIIANTLTNLLLYLVVLPIVIAMLLVYGHHPGWPMLLFPVLLIVQTILIQGASLLIATWNVFYRDVQQIVGVMMTLLFWVTPVFYKSQAFDQRYQWVFDWNPMAVLIKAYRDIFYYSKFPEAGPFFYALAAALGMGIVGFVVYNRQLDNVIDCI